MPVTMAGRLTRDAGYSADQNVLQVLAFRDTGEAGRTRAAPGDDSVGIAVRHRLVWIRFAGVIVGLLSTNRNEMNRELLHEQKR